MRTSLLLTAIFSVAVLAGVINGQHTRLLVGTDHGIWRDAGGAFTLFPSQTVGTIVARAGQTLRFRFAEVNNQGRITSITVDVDDPNVIYQVPCEGKANSAGRSRSSLPNPPVKDLELNQTLDVMSSSAWKGTCRMLAFKLADGSVRSVRVRYQ